MNKIEFKYMMATTAIHQTGDISRDLPDLCVVSEEDDDNFYGNWVTGFGFVHVKFPKSTTRELTSEEVDKYHGSLIELGGMIHPINIKGEDFSKNVVVTKNGSNEVYKGTLMSPVKVGHPIYVVQSTGKTFISTKIKEILNNKIFTQNSIYSLEYV
jgi:hypothetical protein